jgi:Fe-S-cluster containining protein
VFNTVHVQDFQAFACTSCGRCCKPWEIAIEAAQLSAIEGSSAYRSRVKEGYRPLHSERAGVARLGDRGDDACTFLDAQSLCALHTELGGRSKPLGCQLFPYQAVQTPEGMFVSLSFACPPVVAGLDSDVESNRQDLSVALGRYSAPLPDTVESPYEVWLSENMAISWASYVQLEARILKAYRRSEPLESVLSIVLSILRVGAPEGSRWPLLAAVREELSFPMEILAKYLGSMVSAVEDIDDDERRATLARAVESAQAITSERFAMRLPRLDLAAPTQPWILDTYHRYFRNAVLGKSLLKSSVVGRLLSIACTIALASYYAEAYRQARGTDSVTLDCLTDAFAIVECHIVTHSPLTGSYFLGLEETFAKLAELPVEALEA